MVVEFIDWPRLLANIAIFHLAIMVFEAFHKDVMSALSATCQSMSTNMFCPSRLSSRMCSKICKYTRVPLFSNAFLRISGSDCMNRRVPQSSRNSLNMRGSAGIGIRVTRF